MPLIHSGSREAVAKNIKEMVKSGHPQKQAIAAALNNQREFASHKAAGGPVVGLIRSPVAGRTDRLPIHVWEDSYVIPADVVSGWGQGNTEAGARLLDSMISSHSQAGQQRFAAGGRASLRHIPIVAAGGEYVVPPGAVSSMGGGDMQKGHTVLDKMVRSKRSRTAKHMQQLPGPRKN